MITNATPKQLLAIYLNDHLAGATGGVELARRARASNRDDPDFGEPLAEVCAEVEADKQTLEDVVEQLGVRRDPVKPVLAWTAEKLGRLKPNGRLTGYSPLSRLVELEMLLIGITGKTQMWSALERTAGVDVEGIDFPGLSERALAQREVVAALHRKAVSIAFD